MRESLQNKAEKLVNSFVFEFENEFDIETKKIPEVRYIRNFFKFENLGIDNRYKKIFKKISQNKGAAFLPEYNLIITSSLDEFVLAEESTHFIHHQFLKNSNNLHDLFGADSLSEMLGFFCSKLIDPSRKNNYYSDCFMHKTNFQGILNRIKYMKKKGEYVELIHQQGYSMGEKLYLKYINSQISKEDVKKIFIKPLKRKDFAFLEFLHWKYLVLS